jgi:3-oxoacyl-[acyl-carrier protein] reductase
MVTEQLTAAQRAEVEQKIPVGRFCEPEEFAHTVLFLAGENSGFITGEVIDMNGGFHFD